MYGKNQGFNNGYKIPVPESVLKLGNSGKEAKNFLSQKTLPKNYI